MLTHLRLLCVLSIACLVFSCGGDDGADAPACVTLPATCMPSINPTYNDVYSRILAPSCGAAGTGTTCHGAEGKQGGFGVYDVNKTYDALIGVDGHARVEPGKPECSLLMERLTSDDPNFRMPKGSRTKLDEGLLCAVQLWIKNGAMK